MKREQAEERDYKCVPCAGETEISMNSRGSGSERFSFNGRPK